MDVSELQTMIRSLNAPEIRAIAAAVRSELATVDGEISWWKATVATTTALRSNHRSREASLAAHAASEGVLDAARRAELGEDERSDVTVVARAAADAARALVAQVTSPAMAPVLAPWLPAALVAA